MGRKESGWNRFSLNSILDSFNDIFDYNRENTVGCLPA
jgi:hypothetical protein